MPTPIDATVGGADSNSFMLESEVDTYLDDRLNAEAWNAETDGDRKIRAMIEATREITRLSFIGKRTDDIQELSWPRFEAENPDLPDSDDGLGSITFYADDEIPDRVKNAQAELALEFLKAGSTDIAGHDDDLNIKRSKVDVLETEFFSPTPTSNPVGLNAYPRVIQELTPLLDDSVAGRGTLRILRV